MKRLLLLSPVFHGYWRAIERAFVDNGFNVTTCVYDELPTARAKVHNKLLVEVPGKLGLGAGHRLSRRRATKRALEAVRNFRPDIVVAVKSDLFEPVIWDDLDGRRVPVALWLYDELRRTQWDVAHLPPFRAVASYSPADVKLLNSVGINAHYVPLAFDRHALTTPIRTPELVFVGARYRAREELLLSLVKQGVPVRAYGRDWSRHPIDRARTWQWLRPAVPAGRDLSRVMAYRLMGGSIASLNVHGDQDGFTMRTFEAAGVGSLPLIDRADVGELYEPGVEVACFDSADSAAELCRRAEHDAPWRAAIIAAARRRTMAEHTFHHRAAELAKLWA